MADETTPTTTPGTQTSEFKLTAIVMIVGLALESVSTVLHTLQDGGVSFPWFNVVLAACGALLQICSLLGYTKSRTLVKAATVVAPAPSDPK